MPSFTEKERFEDVKCIAATDHAIRVIIDGDPHWIPQSQIDDDSEVWSEGQEGVLVVSHWIAEKKGIL